MANELLMPDIAGRYQQGYAFGNELKQARKAERDQNMLTGLAPQVIAGDPEAFVQAAAVNPDAAVKYDKAGEVLARQSAGLAKWMLDAYQGGQGDRAEVERRYQESLPFLTKMASAHGRPAPGPTFDPASVPLMERFVAQYEARRAGSSETPTGFRQFQMTAAAAGLKPGTPEYQQAANIALGREGRASSAGFGFELVEGADGRKRLQRQNPRTGAVEIYDETTGDFMPVGGAAAAAPAPSSAGGQVPAASMMTSNGVPLQIPPSEMAAFQRAMEADARGEEFSIQVPPSGPATVRTGADPSLVVGRRPEDQAAAEAAARRQVELSTLPAELGMRTDAAVREAGGTAAARAAAESQAEVTAQAGKRARDAANTLDLLDEAERLLPDATSGRLESMRDQGAAFFGQSTQGAQATASLRLIAAKLIANVPRFEGPQSNIDVQFYREAAGDLANPDLPVQTRLAAAQQMRRLQEKYAGGGQRPTTPRGGAPARIQSAADYDALPSGAEFVAPDGSLRRKR